MLIDFEGTFFAEAGVPLAAARTTRAVQMWQRDFDPILRVQGAAVDRAAGDDWRRAQAHEYEFNPFRLDVQHLALVLGADAAHMHPAWEGFRECSSSVAALLDLMTGRSAAAPPTAKPYDESHWVTAATVESSLDRLLKEWPAGR